MEQNTAIVVRAKPQYPALQTDPKQFLKDYSPVKVMKLYKADNTPVLAAQRQDIPTLVAIKQEYGEDYVSGYLALFIVSLEEYLGVTMMTDAQLEETVLLLMEDNYYLNLADINNIMNSVKKGEVKLSKVNGVTLSELFANYRARRFNEMAETKKNSDDSVAKHGYDRTGEGALSDKGLAEFYMEAQMEAAKRESQRELTQLNLDYRLSGILNTFEEAKRQINKKK